MPRRPQAKLQAARPGVDYIRTHDVRALRDALFVDAALAADTPADVSPAPHQISGRRRRRGRRTLIPKTCDCRPAAGLATVAPTRPSGWNASLRSKETKQCLTSLPRAEQRSGGTLVPRAVDPPSCGGAVAASCWDSVPS